MDWFRRSPIASLGVPRNVVDFYRSSQKKITFTSSGTKAIIERRADDIAELTGSTASKAIEEALVAQLLPNDERAASYVNAVLLGRKYALDGGWIPYGVKDALADIFADASTGTNWRPRRNNCAELVRFADRLIVEHDATMMNLTSPLERYELASNLESAISALAKNADPIKVPDHAAQATIARDSLLPAINHGDAKPKLISHFVVTNWDYLKDSTFTLRTMASLLDACEDWDDTPANRNEFQHLCELVLPQWTIDDAKKARKEEDRRRAAKSLIRYPISNGDYVLAPADWIELNPTDAPSATNAGVLTVKFGERYNAPIFLFYTQRNHRDLTRSDKDRLESLASERWPMLAQVKEDEVELVRNPDGGIANAAEVAAAPAIGMFQLYDEGKYPLGGEPPYGAKIIRHGSECAEGEVS